MNRRARTGRDGRQGAMNKRRNDFPILQHTHYLDTAAMALKPQQVINNVQEYMTTKSVNTNRGTYTLGEEATILYEDARTTTAQFINAQQEEIIFTSGTTMGINALANSLQSLLKKGDTILITEMDHHSTIVPWQELAKRSGARLDSIPVNNYQLDLTNFDKKIKKAKIFSCTHISNSIGTINPVERLFAQARQQGIFTILDGAQSIPHMPINIKKIGCDAMAFSGHKIMAPTGTGTLYISKEHHATLQPWFTGGKMINTVTTQQSTWTDAPHKYEAGTQNMDGIIGLKTAIEYINNVGFENIQDHEKRLSKKTRKELTTIKGITIHQEEKPRTGIISFTLDNTHPHDVASILNEHNVCVRAGHHCSMPLMKKIGIMGTIRASLYFYNDEKDVSALIKGVEDAQKRIGGKRG